MGKQRPAQLTFTDCRGCGKRVATTATICHHCNTLRIPSSIPQATESEIDDDPDDDSDHALSHGGYDDHEMDDEASKPSALSGLWRYIAWILLVVFALSAIWPIL